MTGTSGEVGVSGGTVLSGGRVRPKEQPTDHDTAGLETHVCSSLQVDAA